MLTEISDSPGGHARHFWLPVMQMSMFHLSVGSLSPPRIETASTIRSASFSFAISPIFGRSLTVAPVEVSL